MLLTPWIEGLKRRFALPRRSRRAKANRRSRRGRVPGLAQVETLEDRLLLSATYSSDPSPDLQIPDNGQLTDTIHVGDATTIGDVNVTVDITHQSDQDLDVYLVSPNGTRVELFTDVGGGGNNFTGTTLDDEAATAITSGTAPFSGTYRPEGSLSAFDGENAQGNWTLEVNDDKRRNTGTLNSWSIEVAPQAAPTISYPNFSDSTGLQLVGDAAIANGNVLRLTPAAGGMEGAAWYTAEKQIVSLDWGTTFDFNLNENFDSPGGSDGFVFIVQNYAQTYLAGGGGTLGYDNLPNSLAVEFDTFQNGEVSDPSQSHISVHTNGTGANGWDESLSLGSYNTPTIMDDAATHSVKIAYTPGTLSVYLDDMSSPVLSVAVDLSQTLDLDAGRAWVGFTATTGGGYQNHDILNWDYTVLETTFLEVADVSLLEGDAGTSQMVFTVNRTGDTSGSSSLDWATSDGTATTADNDYVAASGQVTFAPGETQKTFSVTVNGDTAEEAHETLVVSFSNATGGSITENSATGTILNDETTISIGNGTAIEGDQSFQFVDAFVPSGAGELDSPTAVKFGPDGNLYVSGFGIHDNVLRYDGATGAFIDEFVSSGSGGLINGQDLLFGPDGNLYVSSAPTDEVLRYDGTTGAFLGAFVTAGDGGLDRPLGMAFGPDGNLYVSSGGGGADEVLRFNGATGAFIDVFVSKGSAGLDQPRNLAFHNGHLYVGSLDTDEVLRYDATNGAFVDVFVSSGSGGLINPFELLFDGNGDLIVASGGSDQILRYDGVTGAFLDAVASTGSGGLDGPVGMTFGSDGNLYVGSFYSDTVLRYGPASQAAFNITLSSPSAKTVTVDYASTDGTAAAGSDYDAVAGTLTFAPGETSKAVLVSTIDDALFEGDETFTVDLSNPTNATIGDASGAGTIYDHTLSIGDVTQLEGDSGTTDFVFTVTREGDIGGTTTVDWTTADGTATVADGDYNAASGTLTLLPGEASGTITVSVNGDLVDEGDETFSVVLSNPSNGVIANDTGQGTIANDDVQISIDDVTVIEGDATAHYRGSFVDQPVGQNFVSLTFGPDGMLYTSNQSGNGAIDRYDGTTGEFVSNFIASGQIIGVRDPLFRDGYLYVGDEYTDEVLRFDATTGAFDKVFVSAGSGGIDGPHGMTFGPDANGDGVAELYVTGRNSANVVRYDGVTGQPLGGFVASGSGGLSLPEGLAFDPTGAFLFVASSGSGNVLKYDAATGAYLGVGAGSPLNSPKDVVFGPDGLMYVASAGNDRILRFTADGTYVDDYVPQGIAGMDNPNRLAFRSDGDLFVSGPGIKEIMQFSTVPEAVFTVSLSQASSQPVTVHFATADGTAVSGSDYDAATGTLTFSPGMTSRTLLVQTIDDAVEEPAETFAVNLSNAVGGNIVDAQGVATIIDSVPPIDAPSGLLSWWTGDGHALDIAGPNEGTLFNGATYSSGEVDSAFEFDGTNYVQAGTASLPTGNADRTIELWVKADSFLSGESYFAGYGNFGSAGQSYHLGTTGSNLFWSQWGTGIGGPALTAGQWHHVAVTNVGDTATLYLDGEAVGSNTVTINTPAGTDFYIGRIPGALGDTRRLDGAVDEVSIYNRALTAAEISSIYVAGAGGKIKPAGITVTPTSGLETTENSAGTASFTVVLNAAPTADVTIGISSSDTSEGTVSASSLTFTASNWFTPQTVVVTGVDDSVRDRDQAYTIVTAAAVSADANYDGLDAADVSVTNKDDEKGGGKPNLLAETVGDSQNITLLTQAYAEAFADYAVQLWTDATGVAPIVPLHVTVADLDGNLLGVTNGNTITLDADAAGIGWFIDATPGDTVEFQLGDPAALGRYDLLTVAAHEVGHALGYEHSEDADDVMAETLAIGTRRLPTADEGSSGGTTVVTPVYLFETTTADVEPDLEPALVPVLDPVQADDSPLNEDSSDGTNSPNEFAWLPDDDDDFDTLDAVFADYGVLEDQLLSV